MYGSGAADKSGPQGRTNDCAVNGTGGIFDIRVSQSNSATCESESGGGSKDLMSHSIRQRCFELTLNLAALQFATSKSDLLKSSRGTADIARARQVCMYLLHTSLSMPYHTIAELFKRDRTTVAHACRLIEDLRDDEAIEVKLAGLETILAPVNAILTDDREGAELD